MSQRVAGPVRTQRLGVRRPHLRAPARRIRLLHAVVQLLLGLRHHDQVRHVMRRGRLNSAPANVAPQVHHLLVPVQSNAPVALRTILASPAVNLNLPLAN